MIADVFFVIAKYLKLKANFMINNNNINNEILVNTST